MFPKEERTDEAKGAEGESGSDTAGRAKPLSPHAPSVAADNEEKLKTKQSAAAEQRHWVSITGLCNNGCIFCLDGDRRDRVHKTAEQVRREIDAGPHPGGRLILSGG